jgi:hypothetical protein
MLRYGPAFGILRNIANIDDRKSLDEGRQGQYDSEWSHETHGHGETDGITVLALLRKGDEI